MTADAPQPETFSEFKDSFSYGSRSDMNFKFLKSLPDAEAAEFFRELLWQVGEAYNDGDVTRLTELAVEWQSRSYNAAEPPWQYDDAPFAPLTKTVRQSRLALISSSGHFVAGDDPKPLGVEEMSQEEAVARIGEFLKEPPTLSAIPLDTPPERLRVRHGGYDIRGSQADPNVTMPYERMVELVREQAVGDLLPTAYSFVGAAAQTPLIKKTGPQWVEMLQAQAIDAALLVPV